MSDRKVICPICTNSKFAVIKRVLPVMSLLLMIDGTSNMVLANCCLNVCFKRNPRRETKDPDPQLSVTSRTTLTSIITKHESQLQPIDIQLSRHVSCTKLGRRENWICRASNWNQTMIVTTTIVQQEKEGEPDIYACPCCPDHSGIGQNLAGYTKVRSSGHGRRKVPRIRTPTALPSPIPSLRKQATKAPN
jgi:hypothetical protein